MTPETDEGPVSDEGPVADEAPVSEEAPPEPLSPEAQAALEKAERRRDIRRVERALELVREAFAELQAADAPGVVEHLAGLEAQLDALRPPEPRKCREYQRATLRAKKGLMGIDPELVVLYCRCFECATLRAKNKLEQPTHRALSPLLVDDDPTPEGSSPSADSA